jgi:DNA-binding transcriptional LysR family regulator
MTRRFGIELYDAFVAVAELSGFGRAAERLHRGQNTVSHQVRKLETKLGCTLFRRSTRSIELTAAGHALLPCARAILRLHEKASLLVVGERAEGLRLGLLDHCVDMVFDELVETMEAVTERTPAIHCSRNPVLWEWFENDEVDAMVVTRDGDRAQGFAVTTERLVWAGRGDFTPSEKRILPLALGPEGCPHRTIAVAALTEAGVPFEVVQTAISAHQLRRAAAIGRSITVLPSDLIGPDLRDLGGKARLPELGPTVLELVISDLTTQQYGPDFVEQIGASIVAAFQRAGYGQPVDVGMEPRTTG